MSGLHMASDSGPPGRKGRPAARWSWWWCPGPAAPQPPGTAGSLSWPAALCDDLWIHFTFLPSCWVAHWWRWNGLARSWRTWSQRRGWTRPSAPRPWLCRCRGKLSPKWLRNQGQGWWLRNSRGCNQRWSSCWGLEMTSLFACNQDTFEDSL